MRITLEDNFMKVMLFSVEQYTFIYIYIYTCVYIYIYLKNIFNYHIIHRIVKRSTKIKLILRQIIYTLIGFHVMTRDQSESS